MDVGGANVTDAELFPGVTAVTVGAVGTVPPADGMNVFDEPDRPLVPNAFWANTAHV